MVNLYAKDRWRIDCKYGTRVVFPSDSERVLNFVRKEFPDEKGWLMEINHALHICVDNNIVEQYLNIYCPECQRFTGNIYKTALEIPEFVNCVHCGAEIENPLQHAIIIYKVL